MITITQQEAVERAIDALRKRAIPFRQENITSKLVVFSGELAVNPIWRVSFDIPMPLGMQDEYFTVEIDASSGEAMGIVTQTQVIT